METREAKRRIEDAARGEMQRYYVEQKNIDHASSNLLKDDFKRKDREARERDSEAIMLNGLYQVRLPYPAQSQPPSATTVPLLSVHTTHDCF